MSRRLLRTIVVTITISESWTLVWSRPEEDGPEEDRPENGERESGEPQATRRYSFSESSRSASAATARQGRHAADSARSGLTGPHAFPEGD